MAASGITLYKHGRYVYLRIQTKEGKDFDITTFDGPEVSDVLPYLAKHTENIEWQVDITEIMARMIKSLEGHDE